jgi:hypothetical protein
LLEEIEVPFPKIRLLIDVTTDASEAEMEKVKADLHRFFPIFKKFGHGARGDLERDASVNAGNPS